MDKTRKQNIITMLICLLLSFALWLYTISSESIEMSIRVQDIPVKLQNADSLEKSNLILKPGDSPRTGLTIKGIANYVYSAKNSDISLSVDLSTYTLKEGENRIPVSIERLPSNTSLVGNPPEVVINVDKLANKSVEIKRDRIKYTAKKGYYIPEPTLKPSIALIKGPEDDVNKVVALMVDVEKNEISTNVEEFKLAYPVDEFGNKVPNIQFNTTENIAVSFAPMNIKEVPVSVTTKNSVDQSIKLEGYTPNPSTIKVAARDTILKNLEGIETEPLDLAQINLQTKEYPLKLKIPYDVVILDNEEKRISPDIMVTVNMDSYATKEIEKTITTVGTPLSPVTLNTNTVKILVSGTNDKINEINLNDFIASVDVEGLKPGNYDLEVKIKAPVDYLVKLIKPNKINVKVGP